MTEQKHISELVREYKRKVADGVVFPSPPTSIVCPTCDGLGHLSYGMALGHPLFGMTYPCPTCNKNGGSSDPNKYGLLPNDINLTWDSIKDVDPTVTEALDAVLMTLERGWGFVYLYGGYGTAKTMILKTAVAMYLKSATPAAYLRLSDMMDEIRSAYDANSPQVEAMTKIRWFYNLPLLAIDEIEKVNETGMVVERRFQIIDKRYEITTGGNEGITLIAANVPPEKLEGAIASRIRDWRFRVVQINAKDMRRIGRIFEQ